MLCVLEVELAASAVAPTSGTVAVAAAAIAPVAADPAAAASSSTTAAASAVAAAADPWSVDTDGNVRTPAA
jgi:hypothetical protein